MRRQTLISLLKELANKAYSLYLQQDRSEKRKFLNILLSNCTFDRGNLYPTYKKPFDMLVENKEIEDWLRGTDDVRTFFEDEEEIQIPAYSIPV